MSKYKSLQLAGFAPLLGMKGVRFIDIQFGPPTHIEPERDAALKAGLPVAERIPSLDPWQDIDGLAALMVAADLVITVSNTNAHIAGALGVPVWNIVPKTQGRMWFHFSGFDTSPWYPSMKLINHRWGDDMGPMVESLMLEVERLKLSAVA